MIKSLFMLVLVVCSPTLIAMDSDDYMSGFLGSRRSGRANIGNTNNQQPIHNDEDNLHKQRELVAILEESANSFFAKQAVVYEENKKKNKELYLNIKQKNAQLESILNVSYDYLFRPIDKVVVFLKNEKTFHEMQERFNHCSISYHRFPGVFRRLSKNPDERVVLNPRTYLFTEKPLIILHEHTTLIVSLQKKMTSPCGYEFALHAPTSLYDVQEMLSVCKDEIDGVYPA